MSYTATTATLAHVVALVSQVRPDWDEALVKAILLSHADHLDGNDLAVAALRFASSDRALQIGPKGIGWRGPHWDGLGTKPPEVAARDQRWCQVCTKPEHRCLTERWADDDHEFEPGARVRVRR